MTNAFHIIMASLESHSKPIKAFLGWKEDTLSSMTSNTIFKPLLDIVFGTNLTNDKIDTDIDTIDVPLDIDKIDADTELKSLENLHKYFSALWFGFLMKHLSEAYQAFQSLRGLLSPEEIIQRPDVLALMRLVNEYMKKHGKSDGSIFGFFVAYLHLNFNTYRLAY